MSPNESTSPVLPYEAIGEKHFLFDLVYNPEKSLFLTYGERQGAKIKNGYEMLVLQAEHAWKIWNKN
jgi:shikimate dehydrogenase